MHFDIKLLFKCIRENHNYIVKRLRRKVASEYDILQNHILPPNIFHFSRYFVLQSSSTRDLAIGWDGRAFKSLTKT